MVARFHLLLSATHATISCTILVKISSVVSVEKNSNRNWLRVHVVVQHISSNISVCIGSIFVIFSPYESALRADDRSVPYFPIFQGTLPWQTNNIAVMKANWYYMHSLHVRRMVARFRLLLLATHATISCKILVKISSVVSAEKNSNRNCVACSRRGSAYVVQYLWMYWTDFRNISPYESALHADDGSVPHFPICQGRCHGNQIILL